MSNSEFMTDDRLLLLSKRYLVLSEAAKVMYAVMTSLQHAAQDNNQVDDNGTVFFSLSNREYAESFSMSVGKAERLRAELVKANLLTVKKRGFNQAAALYLQRPVIEHAELTELGKKLVPDNA